MQARANTVPSNSPHVLDLIGLRPYHPLKMLRQEVEMYIGAGKVPVQPLRRDIAEPLYSQLAADLQVLLDGGQWQPGQMIPSEAELG